MDKLEHINSEQQETQDKVFTALYRLIILGLSGFIIFHLNIPFLTVVTIIILFITFI